MDLLLGVVIGTIRGEPIQCTHGFYGRSVIVWTVVLGYLAVTEHFQKAVG